MVRQILAAASAALLSLSALGTAQAATSATVVIQAGTPQYRAPMPAVAVQYQPPPPPRYEAVPHPRRGMAWEQGHWEWRGHRHVWVPGHWIKARPGHVYHQPRWEERDGRWHMQRGRWDRDRDGVPDRHDRRPNDPRRY